MKTLNEMKFLYPGDDIVRTSLVCSQLQLHMHYFATYLENEFYWHFLHFITTYTFISFL